MKIKYIFEEYSDHINCDDCGITTNETYSVYEDGKKDSYFSTGGLASCYGNEYPSLVDIHEYCINVLKFDVDININSISTFEHLVYSYINSGINCSYKYEETEYTYNDDEYDDDEN